MPHEKLPEALGGSPSLDVDTKSTKVTRFLHRLKGQPDKQAAFSYSSEPVYLSEQSSIDDAGDRDFKNATHADANEDDDLKKFYEPIATYEGRHRYDPKAQWTAQEEKILVRRVRVLICRYAISHMLTCFSLITKYVLGCASCFLRYN